MYTEVTWSCTCSSDNYDGNITTNNDNDDDDDDDDKKQRKIFIASFPHGSMVFCKSQ